MLPCRGCYWLLTTLERLQLSVTQRGSLLAVTLDRLPLAVTLQRLLLYVTQRRLHAIDCYPGEAAIGCYTAGSTIGCYPGEAAIGCYLAEAVIGWNKALASLPPRNWFSISSRLLFNSNFLAIFFYWDFSVISLLLRTGSGCVGQDSNPVCSMYCSWAIQIT